MSSFPILYGTKETMGGGGVGRKKKGEKNEDRKREKRKGSKEGGKEKRREGGMRRYIGKERGGKEGRKEGREGEEDEERGRRNDIDLFLSSIESDSLNDGHHYTPKSLFSWLTRVMYNRRTRINPLWNTIIVGGYDEETP